MTFAPSPLIRFFDTLAAADVPLVGGKNASLGEMIRDLGPSGIAVPEGFATTADAYRHFLSANDLDERIAVPLGKLTDSDASLRTTGRAIRTLIRSASLPDDLAQAIRSAYIELGHRIGRRNVDVAVRSSATAEDLPEASFAGQQESFLNIRGEAALLRACRDCYASLFTDRAISYRRQRGYDHTKIALSVGVQRMVRSDKACAGVMFTLDTDTGFRDMVVINGSWGLGESVVKGLVIPDEFRVFKPPLGDPALRPIVGRTIGAKETIILSAPAARRRLPGEHPRNYAAVSCSGMRRSCSSPAGP